MDWRKFAEYLWQHKTTLWLAALTVYTAAVEAGWTPPW